MSLILTVHHGDLAVLVVCVSVFEKFVCLDLVPQPLPISTVITHYCVHLKFTKPCKTEHILPYMKKILKERNFNFSLF